MLIVRNQYNTQMQRGFTDPKDTKRSNKHFKLNSGASQMAFYNPQFLMGFSCCSGFNFCVVFCESLFVFFSRQAIVLPYLLSVGHCTALPSLGWPFIALPYIPHLTTSDYAFGIFKRFFQAKIVLTHERHGWIFDPVDVLLCHFLTSVFAC